MAIQQAAIVQLNKYGDSNRHFSHHCCPGAGASSCGPYTSYRYRRINRAALRALGNRKCIIRHVQTSPNYLACRAGARVRHTSRSLSALLTLSSSGPSKWRMTLVFTPMMLTCSSARLQHRLPRTLARSGPGGRCKRCRNKNNGDTAVTVFTFSEARQKFAALLERARSGRRGACEAPRRPGFHHSARTHASTLRSTWQASTPTSQPTKSSI